MKQIALKLPGFEPTIAPPAGLAQTFPQGNLGEILSRLFIVILFIASALMFYWMAWGIFHYIFSGGDKEGLGKAKKRITWAIVGFIIIVLSFALQQYLQTILKPNFSGGVVTEITPPPLR